MRTSTVLKIYRIMTYALLIALALMPLTYRRHIAFATSATIVITLVLILTAFQVQRLRTLAQTIVKLDELLELLRDTKRELSTQESMRLTRELQEIRAALLRNKSLSREDPDDFRRF